MAITHWYPFLTLPYMILQSGSRGWLFLQLSHSAPCIIYTGWLWQHLFNRYSCNISLTVLILVVLFMVSGRLFHALIVLLNEALFPYSVLLFFEIILELDLVTLPSDLLYYSSSSIWKVGALPCIIFF